MDDIIQKQTQTDKIRISEKYLAKVRVRKKTYLDSMLRNEKWQGELLNEMEFSHKQVKNT